MNKLRIGIVGIGRMGITHYSIINSHPDIEITGVVDTSKILLSILNKYINGIKIFTDFQDMVDAGNIDAIIVCTPPKYHHPICISAAGKGIHVFCEKPFTTQFNQGIELAQIFESKGLVNQVGYVNRFNDVFVKAKELIHNDVIGNIIRFKSEMFSRTITKTDEGNSWRDSKENGGGAIFEVASHAIDLVNYLVGKPDKITGSALTKIHSKNVEDAICSTMLYKAGISGTLNVNWSDESFRKPTNKIEIFGSKGKLVADQHSLKVYLKTENKDFKLREGWNTFNITDLFKPVPFYVRGNEFTSQLYHFVGCIQDKKKQNMCTFKDATYTLDIIEKIFLDFEQNGKF
jgi:predicted dehydrogenase